MGNSNTSITVIRVSESIVAKYVLQVDSVGEFSADFCPSDNDFLSCKSSYCSTDSGPIVIDRPGKFCD